MQTFIFFWCQQQQPCGGKPTSRAAATAQLRHSFTMCCFLEIRACTWLMHALNWPTMVQSCWWMLSWTTSTCHTTQYTSPCRRKDDFFFLGANIRAINNEWSKTASEKILVNRASCSRDDKPKVVRALSLNNPAENINTFFYEWMTYMELELASGTRMGQFPWKLLPMKWFKFIIIEYDAAWDFLPLLSHTATTYLPPQ